MQLLCSPTDWIWECLENNLCFWKHICCTLLILSPQFAEVDSCVCFFLNRCIFVFSSLHFPPMTLEEFAICLQYHRKWLENHFIGLELFLEDFCVFFFFFSPINVTFIPQTDIFTKCFKQYTCYKLLTLCFSLYLPWASLSLHPTKNKIKMPAVALNSFYNLLTSFYFIPKLVLLFEI